MRTDGITAEHYYPSAISLTAEERDSIIIKVTNIATYCQEDLLKFIVGDSELTDDTWNAFAAQLDAYGLQECTAVYQNAYDEYLSGIR